jgi:hypothetical protein
VRTELPDLEGLRSSNSSSLSFKMAQARHGSQGETAPLLPANGLDRPSYPGAGPFSHRGHLQLVFSHVRADWPDFGAPREVIRARRFTDLLASDKPRRLPTELRRLHGPAREIEGE